MLFLVLPLSDSLPSGVFSSPLSFLISFFPSQFYLVSGLFSLSRIFSSFLYFFLFSLFYLNLLRDYFPSCLFLSLLFLLLGEFASSLSFFPVSFPFLSVYFLLISLFLCLPFLYNCLVGQIISHIFPFYHIFSFVYPFSPFVVWLLGNFALHLLFSLSFRFSFGRF